MRKLLTGLGLLLGFALFTPTVKAQDGGFSDPFFLYYGYFLPRQNALAAQGQPEDFYRAQSIQQQAAAQTDRRGLYGPIGTIGADELDPLNAFGTRSASTRMVATSPIGLRSTVTKQGHSAPGLYYSRTTSTQQGKTYFPTLRSGFGAGRGRSAAPVSALSANRSAASFIPNPAPNAPGGR